VRLLVDPVTVRALRRLTAARRQRPAPLDNDDVDIVAGDSGFPFAGGHALNKDLRTKHPIAA